MPDTETEPIEDTITGDRHPEERLVAAVNAKDLEQVQQLLEELTIDDQRRAISRCKSDDHANLLQLLPAEQAAKLLEKLAEAQAVEILEDIPCETAAGIIHELPDDIGGDLLREMDAEESSAIVEALDDRAEQSALVERISYARDTAGGLMTSSYLAFPEGTLLEEVIQALGGLSEEEQSQIDIQYLYVRDAEGQLTGVLRLRDLVTRRKTRRVEEIMIREPRRVTVGSTLEELEDLFDATPFLGLPVVDDAGELVGLLSRNAVEEALAEHQTDSYLKASGIVSGEELRSMPLGTRCYRRLCWLAPNIVLNMIAASVIAAYEPTLQAVIALAIFLPMVSDMSGCSGNQAVAVSIRELTLGILKPIDYLRVVFKEGMLGIINGVVLGCVLGTVAAVWKGNVFLGLVIGSALAINTVVSVLIGGLVPLVLKRFKVDPALASGPILTTCTDMCGFFLVLNLATMAMSKLT